MLLAIEPFCLRTFSIGPVCRIFRSYHRHRPLKFVGAEEFSLPTVCSKATSAAVVEPEGLNANRSLKLSVGGVSG